MFYQVLRPVFIGGGRDTLVENNIFVDCPQAFHLDARYSPGNRAAQYGDPTFPKGNILRGNIFWRGDGTDLRRTGWDNPSDSKHYRNAWWYHIQSSAYNLVTLENNMVDIDPKFVDEKAGNFALRKNSPAFEKIGFKPIPFAKIGLYRDEKRASWPVEHRVMPLPEQKKKQVQ